MVRTKRRKSKEGEDVRSIVGDPLSTTWGNACIAPGGHHSLIVAHSRARISIIHEYSGVLI